MILQRALFLDRAGVINIDVGYLHQHDQCRFIDGIIDLVKAANDANWRVFVVTN